MTDETKVPRWHVYVGLYSPEQPFLDADGSWCDTDDVTELEAKLAEARTALGHTRQNASIEAQEKRTLDAVLREVAEALQVPYVNWDGSLPKAARNLREENARLREALEWYGDPACWIKGGLAYHDKGANARKAREELKDEDDAS